MNTIAFIPHILGGSISVSVFIDDEPFDFKGETHLKFDVGLIRYSLIYLEKYECPIITCCCGYAGCAGIEMEVLASDTTIAWKMTYPLKFFYSFVYEQYADAYEAFQKGHRYLLDVRRVKCTEPLSYVKKLFEPL